MRLKFTIIIDIIIIPQVQYNNIIVIISITVRCDELPQTTVNASTPKVTGYSGPPVLEGTIVNFYCSSGLVLIGNKSSTCTAKGLWEPDPGEIMCVEGMDIVVVINWV